jgi:hypothetical protein
VLSERLLTAARVAQKVLYRGQAGTFPERVELHVAADTEVDAVLPLDIADEGVCALASQLSVVIAGAVCVHPRRPLVMLSHDRSPIGA